MTHDRILVRRPGSEERKTKGGLVIPATAQDRTKRCLWAEVAAAGPNVRNIEPGDQVLLSLDSALEAEIRGEEFLLVRERDVHAVASEQVDSGTGLYR
jgi:chaperonin GroES